MATPPPPENGNGNANVHAAVPPKREKKRSYTVEEKLAIVQAAKSESLRAVARRFHVDRNCIRAWRDKEAQLAELHPTARRLPGAGRRPSDGTSKTMSAASSNASKRKAESGTTTAESNGDAKKPKLLQDLLLVGFQGKDGALSDDAARQAFDELTTAHKVAPCEYATVGYARVRDVLDAVERGEVEYGVLPVENSTSGLMDGTLDRLIAADLHIVGEIACVHELCLCAVPGTKTEELSCVLSHHAILEHCDAFLTQLETQNKTYIDRQATWDSAGACQILKQEGTRTAAAIASENAATMHGLEVLERGVGDERYSETRYAVIARCETPILAPLAGQSGTNVQSTIVIAVRNETQALFKIVAAFALRNLTIMRIQSRPAATAGLLFNTKLRHWDYVFLIDYLVSTDSDVNDSLLKNLRELSLWIKPLGTYAATSIKRNVEPPQWQAIAVDVV